MPGSSPSRRYVLPSAMLVVAAAALVPTAALADPPPTHPTPPAHNHAGGNGKANGNGNGASKPATKATPQGKAKGAAHGNGGVGNGNANAAHAAGAGASGRPAADPPGNNGTVKIKGVGDLGTIPNNVPHPGCDFQVMWYGFDQGPTIVSTVSFAMQAPTRDVGLSVAGPAQVFVGGDPATGAGTPTGLDGAATYHLTFAGPPHNKQGYHVRLTVHTPFSQGNDTKTKVFWVSACGPAATTAGSSSTSSTGTTTSSTSTTSTPRSDTPGTVTSSARHTAVPTAVEAGADRTWPARLANAWHGTALPLLVLVVGGLLAALGMLLRRRAHGPVVRL